MMDDFKVENMEAGNGIHRLRLQLPSSILYMWNGMSIADRTTLNAKLESGEASVILERNEDAFALDISQKDSLTSLAKIIDGCCECVVLSVAESDTEDSKILVNMKTETADNEDINTEDTDFYDEGCDEDNTVDLEPIEMMPPSKSNKKRKLSAKKNEGVSPKPRRDHGYVRKRICECELCGEKFTSWFGVKQHIIFSHPDHERMKDMLKLIDEKHPSSTTKRTLISCPECNFGAYGRAILKHMTNTHSNVENFEKKYEDVKLKYLEEYRKFRKKTPGKRKQAKDESLDTSTSQSGDTSDQGEIVDAVKGEINESSKESPKPRRDHAYVRKHICKCKLCEEKFTSWFGVKQHIMFSHPDHVKMKEMLKLIDEEHPSSTTARSVKSCPECNFGAYGRSILNHMKSMHPNVEHFDEKYNAIYKSLLEENNKFRKRPKKGRQKKEKPEFYECSYCRKRFTVRASFKIHEKNTCTANPNRQKKVYCSVCGLSRYSKEEIEKHKLEVHDGKTNFMCELCGKSFTRAGRWQHYRICHPEVYGEIPKKVFVCPECGVQFTGKLKLAKHIQFRHRDERPFQCDRCSSDFKTSGCLQKHIRRVHLKQYRYHCEHCGHGVDRLKFLKTHICGREHGHHSSEAGTSVRASSTPGGEQHVMGPMLHQGQFAPTLQPDETPMAVMDMFSSASQI